ncbi:MAG: DEAD/DEAH box helicase [Candidatus Nanohaloarchaea archaeon]|nr:DEAD/DEAH box helicase [Candidatus Nanohaloarchaea archaeon]
MDPRQIVPGPLKDTITKDATDGTFAGTDDLNDQVEQTLEQHGITKLYQHQQEALDALDDGSNVILSTPTASGKSLVYTIPALERALDGKRTLYIAPMRALINDQTETLRDYVQAAGMAPGAVQSYTGQLDRGEKRKVREQRPRMLLTTIDMVHYSLLPYATQQTWSWLFNSLDLIVVDELHEFRGVFGSHVALVFRRLQRILDHFDADPDIVACSATIGNPVEHARKVTGTEDWHGIDEDSSATGEKRWVIADNQDSPHPVSKQIMQNLVERDVQTLAFTNARQTSERYARNLTQDLREEERAELADKIRAYHAALSDDERRTVERKIRSGELLGVWSTTALELGVDIGSLDAVVIDGYPGSRMQVQQQAGRAGRGEEESHVFLVPGSDNLDHYIAANTDELFAEPESAKVNPSNTEILPQHIAQAAVERPVTERDDDYFGRFQEGLLSAAEAGLIEQGGRRWMPTDEAKGKPFNLRNIDDRTIYLNTSSGKTLTTLSYGDAIKDVYPEAIYLHGGRQYRVEAFDTDRDQVTLERKRQRLSYYTKPQKDKQIEVNEELERREGDRVDVFLADVTVHGNVTGYFERDKSTNETIATHDYAPDRQLPFSFRTKAIGFKLKGTPKEVDTLGDGLHAAEHAIIGVMPLHVLCDRNHDLGGLSTELHGYTGGPAIFIHEGHEGGVGLVDEAFDILATIVEEGLETVDGCDCEEGCDACVYSPTCGNANQHLDKQDGATILDFLDRKLPDQDT